MHQTLHAEKLVRASGIDIIDRSTIGSTRSRCTFASSRDTCFANAPYNRCQQQFLQHVSTSWSIIKDLNPSFVSHRLIDSLIFCTSFYGRLLRLALTFRFTVRPTQMASPLWIIRWESKCELLLLLQNYQRRDFSEISSIINFALLSIVDRLTEAGWFIIIVEIITGEILWNFFSFFL